MLKLLLIFLLSLSYSGAFRFVKNKRVCTYDIINTINTRFMSVKKQPTIKEINIAMLPMISLMPSIALALDDDTLNALGDLQELNEALDNAIDPTAGAAADLLTRLVSSPGIIAVPIVAGLGVAIGFGFLVFNWGQAKDDIS